MTEDNSLTGKVSRRFTMKALGIGAAGAALTQVGAVTGHAQAWGDTAEKYPVQPYTLTAGALEAFSITERLHVRIDGVGEDIIALTGIAMFQRSTPVLSPEAKAAGAKLTFATALTTAEFRSLQALGESKVFGKVRASSSGLTAEMATVQPNKANRDALTSMGTLSPMAGTNTECRATLSPKIELESIGETVNLGSETITLGSEVTVVPPVGDVARTEETKPLYTSDGRRIGTLLGADIEIGPILHRIPA